MPSTARPLLLALATVGCTLIGEPGSGVSATEVLTLPDFDGVHLANQIDLTIAEGDEISGTFTCDDNLLDNPRFEVRGSVLVIDTPLGQEMRPETSCHVDLVVTDLKSLELSGSGSVDVGEVTALSDVRSSGSGETTVLGTDASTVSVRGSGSGHVAVLSVDTHTVEVKLSGSGGATLAGVTDELVLDLSASGRLDAADLEAIDVDVSITGSGGAEVYATGLVSGQLSGSGDLTVNGPATIDVRTSGSGRVR